VYVQKSAINVNRSAIFMRKFNSVVKLVKNELSSKHSDSTQC